MYHTFSELASEHRIYSSSDKCWGEGYVLICASFQDVGILLQAAGCFLTLTGIHNPWMLQVPMSTSVNTYKNNSFIVFKEYWIKLQVNITCLIKKIKVWPIL